MNNFLRVLRHGSLLIVLGLVLGALAAYAYASTRPVEYSATSTLLAANQTRVATYIRLATTEAVLQPAIDKVGVAASPKTVAGWVLADTPRGTNILSVTVTADEAQTSADLSNAIAEALIVEANTLEASISESTVAEPLAVVDEAAVPSAKGRQSTAVLLAAGGFVGACLGAALAFLRDLRGTRIRSAREVAAMTRTPVLATIPRSASGPDLSAQFDEALTDGLRRTFRFLTDADRRSFTLLGIDQTSANGTIALDLALVLSQAGQRVVLIDADLRDRSLTTQTGFEDARGLSDLLSRACTLPEAARQVRGGTLTLIPAGTPAPNADELASSDAMSLLVGELESACDVLLVCTSPSRSSSPDDLGRVRTSGGSIILVTTGKTNRRKLLEAVENTPDEARLRGVIVAGGR